MASAVPSLGQPLDQAVAHPAVVNRLLFVDNLRVFLTILVILHHLMITYAGTGSWYYNEGRQDDLTVALGAWFVAINQAYFMGLFLLVAAYFVPGAYDRKGAARFVKDRLVRLGIPLAVYSWLINPLMVAGLKLRSGESAAAVWAYFPARYLQENPILGNGPLWFVETLLLFSIFYSLWRLLLPRSPTTPSAELPFPADRAIILLGLLLGGATYIVRLWFPVDSRFLLLNLQLPFFAQYVALFLTGLLAYRRGWLLILPDKTGRRWLLISVLLIFLWWPGVIAGGALESVEPFKGGWHWQALLNALWESFMCLALCTGLVYLFHRCTNQPSGLSDELARSAYAAYILHAPLIVFLAICFSGLALHPLFKFLLLSLVSVPLCFVLGGLLRRLPYAERVL